MHILKNCLVCSFTSFSTVSVTIFINKPESSRDFINFMISPNFLVESINILGLVFFLKAASVAATAAVNPEVMKRCLAKGANTFFIKVKPVFTKGPRKLSNPPFWQVNFLVVPFNKIPLFSKELITFIIFFVPLFVSAIPESSFVAKFLPNSFYLLLNSSHFYIHNMIPHF